MARDSEGSKPELRDFPSQRFIHGARKFLQIFQYTFFSTLIIGCSWMVYNLHPESWDLEGFHSSSEVSMIWRSYLVAAIVALVALLWLKQMLQPGRPVYLVDFTCYKPPDSVKVTRNMCREYSERSGLFDKDSLDFQSRIAERAGLGDSTYLTPGFHELYNSDKPVTLTMHHAREEAELVMFGAVSDLLKKTGLHPQDIDILVVNCSLFNPTPSLTSMIVNHFKLRDDIITYNLAGMGCSAGVIAVGLARDLLQVYPNKNAVVVSTENITQNWYRGKERSMLLPNILFRMGASAMFMSNQRKDKSRAKYELLHVVRVHMGADDKSYKCVFQHPDEQGVVGVELNRDLVSVASNALKQNMTRMGPFVLPWSEFLFLGINLLAAKVLRMKVKAYVPDFKTAFNHFCLHAGGRAVIEGLSRQLGLPKEKTQPAFNTLEWYGNTSSSTVWYSLGYIESCQGVKKGEIVWQVGFGSGFKCNSSVWRAMKNVKVTHKAWAHLSGT